MENPEIDQISQQFMIQLYEQTGGDPSAQVSMYDVGSLLGLDRDSASRVAEELIGLQFAEIRTLSGGIGIGSEGIELVQGLIGPPPSDAGGIARLGNDLLLNPGAQQAVKKIVTEVKDQTGALGLDFDTLTELMADLKTIDAQLESSRPKTAIIRECMYSIGGVLKSTANSGLYSKVNGLAGD